MNIEEQQRITDVVMEKIFPISPFAIVAGGAPRDWYFKKEATDIDIFFYRPDLETEWSVLSTFKSVGLNLKKFGTTFFEDNPLYKTNPSVQRVYNSTIDNLNFQFIQMNEKTFHSVVPKFPLNICMVWYKYGKIDYGIDFLRAVKHKAIVKVNSLYADGDKYLQKIRSKFPDYKYYSSYEELAKRLLDK